MKYNKGHENWLDFARLIFSTSVVLLHIYNLTPNAKESNWLEVASKFGSLGVPAFFAISGFVIFMAYDNSASIKNYALSRFFRLYPAYIFIITSTGFVAIVLLPKTNIHEFLTYIASNSVFLNFLKPSFGDLFLNNPMSAFNGALWTIKIEVAFYCTVPFISYCTKKSKLLTLILLYATGKACQIFTPDIASLLRMSETTLAHQFPQQLPLFISGYACYLYYNLIEKYMIKFAITAGLLLYFNVFFLTEICFTILVLTLFVILPKTRLTIPFGDISYGVYIIHFPLIQTLILFNIPQRTGIPLFTILTLIATFLLAYILSHTIEKPFLNVKKRFLNRKLGA